MNTNKLLTTVALIAFSLGLPACSALKPDHPQVKESFKERRAPRDNMLAASGALMEQKSSNFQPVNSSQVVDRPATPTQSMPAMNIDAMQNAIQQPTSAAPSGSAKEAPKGFFDRLLGKFSDATSSVPASIKVARKPMDNNDFEQGSTNSGYSYYDMANEVLPAHPVPQVKEAVVKTISSDFGYLSAPSKGYNVIKVAQGQEAAPMAPTTIPSAPEAPVAPPAVPAMQVPSVTSPAAPAMPVPPAAPTAAPSIPVAPPAPASPAAPVMPVPSVAPPAAPAAPAAPVMTAPTELAPQAPELPRMDPTTAPVAAPAAPKPPVNEPKVEMPKAPEIPANEQIKSSSEKLPEPELKDVPAKPVEQPVASVAPKPQVKKPVKRVVKKVSTPKKESGDPYTEKPIPAEISGQLSGDEKVTGYLK